LVASHAQIGEGAVWFSPSEPTITPYYERDSLLAGNQIAGPAMIFQFDTTTVISPGWNARVDQWGNLILEL
jgi:N-methylhydantoinase A